MIKIFKFFFIILLTVTPLVWLSNFPGEVKILWKNYFIETSFVSLIIFIGLIFLLIFLIISIYRKIENIPKNYRFRKQENNLFSGRLALANLAESLVIKDSKKIEKNARQIKKFLGDQVLSTFLLAKSSINKKDFTSAKKYLELLLKNKEGECIALRGLISIALEEKKNEIAYKYLKRIIKLKPNDIWALNKLSIIYAKLEKWEQAAKSLEKINLVNFPVLRNNRASFLLQSGANLKDLWEASNNFIPTIVQMIKVHLDESNEQKAFTILKNSWDSIKYIELIDIFMTRNIRDNKSLNRRFKLVSKLLKPNLEKCDESKLAMSKASFYISLWAETKKYLDMIPKENWDQRVIDLWKSLENNTKRIKIPIFPKLLISPPAWKCEQCEFVTEKWVLCCKNCNSIGKVFWTKSKKEINNMDYIESLF